MWNKKLTPLAGRVILRFDTAEADEKFIPHGALYIPDTQKRDKDEAEVLAVGPGKYDANGNFVAPPVAVGDKVLSNPVWGKDYRYWDADGKVQQVVIVGYDSIIAIVN